MFGKRELLSRSIRPLNELEILQVFFLFLFLFLFLSLSLFILSSFFLPLEKNNYVVFVNYINLNQIPFNPFKIYSSKLQIGANSFQFFLRGRGGYFSIYRTFQHSISEQEISGKNSNVLIEGGSTLKSKLEKKEGEESWQWNTQIISTILEIGAEDSIACGLGPGFECLNIVMFASLLPKRDRDLHHRFHYFYWIIIITILINCQDWNWVSTKSEDKINRQESNRAKCLERNRRGKSPTWYAN